MLANLWDRARIYRNDAPRSGHWLAVRAIDPALHRDALGARITLVGRRRQWTGRIVRASGYLSSHPPLARFGLGSVARLEAIEVLWPDGHRERFALDGVDRAVTLERGSGGGRP